LNTVKIKEIGLLLSAAISKNQ